MTARVTNAQKIDRIYIAMFGDENSKGFIARHDEAVFGDGNGKKGLIRRQDEDERNWKILFGAAIIVFGAFVNHSYSSWQASARIENDVAFISREVVEAEPTPTVASSPPPAETPSRPLHPLPTPVPAFPRDEREWLARLCVVEARGMDEARDQACLSIISTVLTRASRQLISDGTIRGTLTWGCGPETVSCQFPAYTVNGCAGISAGACPLSYPDDLEHFRDVVDLYLSGIPPRCAGYLFYGIRDFDRPECVIASRNGQYLNFWERVGPHE